jgi:hypothetical protein
VKSTGRDLIVSFFIRIYEIEIWLANEKSDAHVA